MKEVAFILCFVSILSKPILLSLMTFHFKQAYFVKFNDFLFSFLFSCLFCL